MVREAFPDAPQVSTDELRAWLERPESQRPVLLDTRAPEEYAVSRLEGAQLAQDEDAALRALEGKPKDTLIVAYCSVGYRSSSLTVKLASKGYTNVHNLEGSIFEWANRGFPVERAGEPVEQVHPYDEEWGRLLERGLWAFSAD